MVKEKQTSGITYVGNTVEEQIQSAQIVAIGRGILQRFGSQMTEDERNFIYLCFGFFIKEISEAQGEEDQTAQARSGEAFPTATRQAVRKQQ